MILHTLNEAWVKILARQIVRGDIDTVLLVCSNEEEMKLWWVLRDAMVMAHRPDIFVKKKYISAVERDMCNNVDIMYDDILISHDLHDIMIKDYLAKHCKRLKRYLARHNEEVIANWL